MADPIVITGDLAVFPTAMGVAILPPMSTAMSGTGKVKIGGKPICVDGDERTISLPVAYTTATHAAAGSGTLTIQSLDAAQKSTRAKSGGKPVLIAKGKFIAQLMVLVPAQTTSTPPVVDNTVKYVGQGEFQTTNTRGKLGG
jgi:uncharacterized Zn-binding protein involved in type VI secretion